MRAKEHTKIKLLFADTSPHKFPLFQRRLPPICWSWLRPWGERCTPTRRSAQTWWPRATPSFWSRHLQRDTGRNIRLRPHKTPATWLLQLQEKTRNDCSCIEVHGVSLNSITRLLAASSFYRQLDGRFTPRVRQPFSRNENELVKMSKMQQIIPLPELPPDVNSRNVKTLSVSCKTGQWVNDAFCPACQKWTDFI